MAEHLGPGTGEVYDSAREVLDFWFGLTTEQQFAKDDALGWRGEPETMLAAIILLDQFSRNLYRGQARAFEADPLALSLTRDAIDKRWDGELPPERAVFLLMPLMHAEHAAAQALSVAKFDALGQEENTRFARDHAEVFARFGRFPGRNAALGRETTPEEAAYLSQPGAGW